MKVDGRAYRSIWPVSADSPGGTPEAVELIDQRALPHEFVIARIETLAQAAHAIADMQVRGAPLIGAAAAFGVALAMNERSDDAALAQACTLLAATRPTAVNLAWALARMRGVLAGLEPRARAQAAWREAAAICDEDVALNLAIGRHGLALLREIGARKRGALQAMTHCNAGWLATVDVGTALAPVYAAFDAGVAIHVWVSETRPRNQGALTCWELAQHGVAHTLIADNAAGLLMRRGEVDVVLVGADRVTRVGDVCNKIGTYLKALAARDCGVPFYAAVPGPTIDWRIDAGSIEIEQRAQTELTHISGLGADAARHNVRLVPARTQASNFAFDVTPAHLVSGLITERGVCAAEPGAMRALFPDGERARSAA